MSSYQDDRNLPKKKSLGYVCVTLFLSIFKFLCIANEKDCLNSFFLLLSERFKGFSSDYLVVNPLTTNVSRHIETSQLTSFYMIGTFDVNMLVSLLFEKSEH